MGGKSIISNSYLEDIGDAIRYKKSTEETFYPSQMGDAIRSIEGIVPTGTMEIDANGVYDVTEKAEVDVDVQPDLRPLSVSENGSYQPDGFDGYSGVDVSVEGQWIDYDDVPVTLPEEYQRVEYIKSSGAQHIDLPFGFYPTDYVSVKGSIDDISNRDGKYMVTPIRWNTNDNRFTLLAYNNSNVGKCFCAGYGNVAAIDTILNYPCEVNTDIHLFVYKKYLFYSPDLSIATGVKDIVFRTESSALRLFYGINSDTAGKICYYIHEKADGRKLALYACYRKSDGVIGMYDVENDVFYTNDGTGEFTKGQDI